MGGNGSGQLSALSFQLRGVIPSLLRMAPDNKKGRV